MLFSTGCSPLTSRLRSARDKFNAHKDNIYYVSDWHKPVDYYKDYSTSIEYPTEHCPIESGVFDIQGPQTLERERNLTPWDLTLQEVIHIALANNAVIRDAGGLRESRQNRILSNPNGTPTAYDIEILESGVLFGSRGVEAALADFDARFTTQMTWGRSEELQNTQFFSVPSGQELWEDTAAFSSRVEKTFANSGSVTFQYDMSYSQNNLNDNSAQRLFPSAYTGFVQGTYRQPLLAGRGTEFTRIAGPISNSLTGVSGVSQGVLIARINTDITLAQFEREISDLVRSLESSYWDLYLTYMTYQAEIDAMKDSVRNLNRVKAREDDTVVIYQAENAYENAKARVEQSLADIYDTEATLRRMMGLHVNNGRIIRPSDAPSVAAFHPDWTTSLAEALTRRVELRQQKWNIKSLELQLLAARSLVKPRLDFVTNYRVNGFGDHLIADPDDQRLLNSAMGTLTRGDQTGWNVGFEFSLPLGLRSAQTQVRNYESRLTKAREVYVAQEMDVSHQLAVGFRDLGRWREAAKTQLRRQETAKATIEAFELRREGDSARQQQAEAIDFLLRSRDSLRDARIAYYRSIVEYNKSILNIQYYKGILLDYNNIMLEEGRWCPSAYQDALRRAYERTYAKESTKLHTEPMGFISRYGHPERMPEGMELPADEVVVPAPEDTDSESSDESNDTDMNDSMDDDTESTDEDNDEDVPSNEANKDEAETAPAPAEEKSTLPLPVDDASVPKLLPIPGAPKQAPPVANPYPPPEGRVVEVELVPPTPQQLSAGRVRLMSVSPDPQPKPGTVKLPTMATPAPKRFTPQRGSGLCRTPTDSNFLRRPHAMSKLRPTPAVSSNLSNTATPLLMPVPSRAQDSGIQQVSHESPATPSVETKGSKPQKLPPSNSTKFDVLWDDID